MLSVEFNESGIFFPHYSYPASSVFPAGTVAWSRVTEINSTATPPEIRLADEILFVTAAARPMLADWSARKGVADVPRVDVWGLLLEPFLDTTFTDKDEERAGRMLQANNVSATEAAQVREEVRECMLRYNIDSGLWDWCHLGLSDALDARMGRLAGESCRLADEAFRTFYWYAMELALRGKPLPSSAA